MITGKLQSKLCFANSSTTSQNGHPSCICCLFFQLAKKLYFPGTIVKFHAPSLSSYNSNIIKETIVTVTQVSLVDK